MEEATAAAARRVSADFLQILAPHPASDVTIACRRAGGSDLSQVRFFCHRAALARLCPRFAATCQDEGRTAEAQQSKRRRVELRAAGAEEVRAALAGARQDHLQAEVLDADDDIVFEVLRFIYCGVLHFPRGLLGRFWQLLAVAEQLGLEQEEQREEKAGGGSLRGLLAEPGVERWLCGLPAAELVGLLRGGDAEDSRSLARHKRVALLSQLSRLRPEEFSVKALGEFGAESEDLLSLHPGLVHVSVLSMAGETVLRKTLDCATTVAEVKANLYAASWAENSGISLVFGGSVLEDKATLKDLGAAGFGCELCLCMVRQAVEVKWCLCRQPAVRFVVKKEGPNHGRAFHRCSGVRGMQCPFFEWAE